MQEDNSSQHSSSKWKKLFDQAKKFGLFQVFKFAAATGIGFLVNEFILILGVVAIYHSTQVPGFENSSLIILGLDALALGIGDTVGFIINEHATVNGQGEQRRKGRVNWLVRWSKYQLATLLGNLMVVGVQLALLATISLSPIYGNIVGATVSYPVTYIVSMHFVWSVHPFRARPEESQKDIDG